MPVTTIAMAMDVAVGFAAWTSQLSVFAKIIITFVLICKHVLFFCSVWISEGDRTRQIEVTGCILSNIGIIIYAFLQHELLLGISAVLELIPLLIWAFSVVYDFPPKTKQA